MSGVTVLSAEQLGTLAALLDRMLPSDELGPGAIEMGAMDYLMLALAGPYAPVAQVYREGLDRLEAAAQRVASASFVDLHDPGKDSLIGQMERGELPELQQPPTEAFFDLVWKYLREGLFSDPEYGGNTEIQGWKLIGFPLNEPAAEARTKRPPRLIEVE